VSCVPPYDDGCINVYRQHHLVVGDYKQGTAFSCLVPSRSSNVNPQERFQRLVGWLIDYTPPAPHGVVSGVKKEMCRAIPRAVSSLSEGEPCEYPVGRCPPQKFGPKNPRQNPKCFPDCQE